MVSSPEQTVAGVPLLATKLFAPRWRRGLVLRPRLVAQLDQGTGRPLTLVCAPAGFGKTTLLAEWLAAAPTRKQLTAWVSLDPGDNDPVLFWTYVITALQAIPSGIGGAALSLLHSPQPPPIETVLTTMINELVALGDDVALVLDDYHVIEAQPIHGAVAFLLDHLPPQLHLVVSSRADPPLPLARLRVHGDLTELRAADLRFAPDEAAAFLNDVMRLDLSAADVTVLETRTEGWIAGLQLAALSMRGRADVAGFISAFAGDARYIVDYLVEEVLQRQPEHVRRFLLQTSMLDRLSGGLCDAVTGRHDGRQMLEVLERGNLFLVPLDDNRRWYRYHHLFADVLKARLSDELPGQLHLLHGRASEWYEQNGLPFDAIRHAFVAGDLSRAADLIELAAPTMRRSRQEATLLGWLKMLPDEVVRVRPVLSVVYAAALLSNGELEGVEARLREAERWLDATADRSEGPEASPAEMVVADHEEFRRLPASIAVHLAGRALAVGDVTDTVRYARRALDVVPEDDHFYRGAAAALLGLASWTSGDLDAAHRSYADGMASLQRAGYIADAVGGVTALADIRIAQGRLREAMSTYERALHLAAEQGTPGLRGTADVYMGMGEIHRERNELDAAAQHLMTSKDLGEAAGFPRHPYRWRVVMARIREARGDPDGALHLFQEAERLYVSDFHPDVRPIAAMKARVWAGQGRLDLAFDWARKRDLSVEDDLDYLGEFEHVTLARLLIARFKQERSDGSILQAIDLLERLLDSAHEGGRTGSEIETLVLLALAHEARGDVARALVPLRRALALAEPEGYVRVFVDEGMPMRDLLRHANGSGIATASTKRLLSAFDAPVARIPAPVPTSAAALAEPLTPREVEVLRLIAAGLRNEEIAGQLFVGLSTVKRHIANAYGKLQVTHRTEAVARANELKLL